MIKFETIDGTLCRMVEPEPKPLLADAKVGDLCKTDLDEWIQIDDAYPESPSPILYHYDRPFKGNIIHTEPLAPEGSAEWAWQMLMLGETVYNPAYYYTPSHGLINPNMLGNCSKQSFVDRQEPSGWQLYEPKIEPPKEPEYVICKRCGGTGYEIKPETDKEPIADCDNCKHRCTKSNIDYCQMYEPKPTFKVGDWVKHDVDSYLQVIEPSDKDKTWCRTLSGIMVYPYTSLLTKVSPSEVVIHIGCLSGTIGKSSDTDRFLMWHSSPKIDFDYSIIKFSALDAPTRELVESLLEAMREEK